MNYKISEIFHSINGEPPFSGVPALFIRFYGCNATCTWCDTKYSWLPGNPYQEVSLSELSEIINQAKEKLVILTGGEPTLWNLDLLVQNSRDDVTFLIETNGSMKLTKGLIEDSRVNFAVSPKLKNAGLPFYKFYKNLYPTSRAIFKYVLVDKGDVEEVMQEYYPEYPDHEHYVTVDGTLSLDDYTKKLKEIWEVVTSNNYPLRLYVQLHRLAFGVNARGV